MRNVHVSLNDLRPAVKREQACVVTSENGKRASASISAVHSLTFFSPAGNPGMNDMNLSQTRESDLSSRSFARSHWVLLQAGSQDTRFQELPAPAPLVETATGGALSQGAYGCMFLSGLYLLGYLDSPRCSSLHKRT